jgi:hypothetical protein
MGNHHVIQEMGCLKSFSDHTLRAKLGHGLLLTFINQLFGMTETGNQQDFFNSVEHISS